MSTDRYRRRRSIVLDVIDVQSLTKPRNSDGNPDSPQVVVFLTSIIDIIERLCNVLHTLACRVRLQYVWLA